MGMRMRRLRRRGTAYSRRFRGRRAVERRVASIRKDLLSCKYLWILEGDIHIMDMVLSAICYNYPMDSNRARCSYSGEYPAIIFINVASTWTPHHPSSSLSQQSCESRKLLFSSSRYLIHLLVFLPPQFRIFFYCV